MANRETEYVHGYASAEQQRLIDQAAYLKDRVILRDVDYSQGGSLLEIGCGVGAVLATLGCTYPNLKLAGIDIAPKQIDMARAYLNDCGFADADLRVGDAAQLPWPDESFDHVYIIWVLEHVPDPAPMLREAHRVLKPGGTITLTEPDYDSFRTSPASEDYDYYVDAQRDLFARSGNPLIGRQLGGALSEMGFQQVRAHPIGFHYFANDDDDELARYVAYAAQFMTPMVPALVEQLGHDANRLRRGIAFFESLPNQPNASVTQLCYRATGIK